MSKGNAVKQRREFRSPAQWRAILERFDSTDLTVVEFCRQQGLCVSNFYRWRQLLASGKPTRVPRAMGVDRQGGLSAPTFVELPAACSAPSRFAATPRWHIELDLGDGIVLRLAR